MILSTFTTRDMRMDRGNRQTVVASTLLALILLVLSDQPGFAQTAGFEMPTAPKTTPAALAVVQADLAEEPGAKSDGGAILQVVGKQPSSNNSSSGGLFQSLLGNRSQSQTATHQHQHTTSSSNHNQATTQSSSQSEGLLSGLFGRRSSSSKTESRVVTPVPNDSREPANWDGVPFHQARQSNTASTSAPIRDPGAARDDNTQNARVVRGSSPKSIPVPSADTTSTTSSRRSIPAPIQSYSPSPAVVTRPVPSIPRPASSPATSSRMITSTETSVLSTNTSSRRSDRRSIDALDASEIAAAAQPREIVRETLESTAEVIAAPKVARRELPSTTKTATTPAAKTVTTPATKAVATPAPVQQEAVAKVEVPKAVPTTAVPTDTVPSVTVKQAIKSPAKPAETVSIAEAKPQVNAPSTGPAMSTLTAPIVKKSAQPEVAKSAPATRYSTPADPADLADAMEDEPLGSVPAVPYAASTPNYGNQLPAIPTPATSAPTLPTPTITGNEFQPRGTVVSNRNGSGALATPFQAASSMPSTDFAPRMPSGDVATQHRQDGNDRIALTPSEVEQPRTLMPLRSSTAGTGETVSPQTPPSFQAPGQFQPINQLTEVNSPTQEITTPTTKAFERKSTGADKTMATTKANETTRALEANQSTVASELPGIRVATFGPTQIMIRQSHPYEIRIENRGSIDASGVIVRAHVPSWAEVQGSSASRGDVEATAQSGQVERLVWKIDHLPAGATERMFVRLKAVRSGSHDMDVDWTLAPQKSVSTVYVQEPKIAVTIDGPDEVTYGQSKTYKVRISNPGDGIAPNVMFTLSPNSATPQTQRIGDIPAGKEAQIEIELTAQDLGDLNINGLASGDLELRAEATKTIRVAAAKLQATLSGPQVKYQNTESVYRLEIKNAGTATSEQVVASLRLPVGVKYLGGLEPATQRADLLTWKIDSLAPGAVRDYQFKCNMTATGDQMFAFDCRGTAAGQADVAIATRVEAIADLVLTVNDPPAPAPVGADVTYEIIVRNRGSKEATDVRTIAQFSNGIEPQRIEGHNGQVVTGQVLFESIPRIGPGEEVVLRIIAQADSDGHHRFRTEVRSGDTVLVAEEATHFMSPQSDRVSRRSDEKTAR